MLRSAGVSVSSRNATSASGPAQCVRASLGPRPKISLYNRTIALETSIATEVRASSAVGCCPCSSAAIVATFQLLGRIALKSRSKGRSGSGSVARDQASALGASSSSRADAPHRQDAGSPRLAAITGKHSARKHPPTRTRTPARPGATAFAFREQREESGRPSGWLLRWTRTGRRDSRTASPPPVLPGSNVQRALDRDHGGAAGVDGVDDLGVVNALEVDRGDAEVGVAELAFDDDQRHALAGHLDGVGVA